MFVKVLSMVMDVTLEFVDDTDIRTNTGKEMKKRGAFPLKIFSTGDEGNRKQNPLGRKAPRRTSFSVPGICRHDESYALLCRASNTIGVYE
jgi:hypothetical protein